jgi:hypothetical protein
MTGQFLGHARPHQQHKCGRLAATLPLSVPIMNSRTSNAGQPFDFVSCVAPDCLCWTFSMASGPIAPRLFFPPLQRFP